VTPKSKQQHKKLSHSKSVNFAVSCGSALPLPGGTGSNAFAFNAASFGSVHSSAKWENWRTHRLIAQGDQLRDPLKFDSQCVKKLEVSEGPNGEWA